MQLSRTSGSSRVYYSNTVNIGECSDVFHLLIGTSISLKAFSENKIFCTVPRGFTEIKALGVYDIGLLCRNQEKLTMHAKEVQDISVVFSWCK